MFNNDLFSDVKFVVQKAAAQSESESKQVIPAHKFVLSIGSLVFEAMFYGVLAETTEVHFVSLADNFTVEFSNLLKLSSGMENKTAGPVITGSFEKQAPGSKLNTLA